MSIKKIVYILSLINSLEVFCQESALLDTNDIAARIYADGRLFNGQFEVPKGSGHNTINQLGIWIGGIDVFGDLLVAAQIPGNTASDFNYGPIAFNYNDSTYISKYNRVWKVSKSVIEYHRLNFGKPGYKVPAAIADWPGNGNPANGEARDLAPYIDANYNGNYDPENGDYPDFRGDQAIFFMMNDVKYPHPVTDGDPLQVEVHGMAYEYAEPSDSAINQTVFLHLQFINRFVEELRGVCVGILTDMNIGDKNDDYVGSDSSLALSYTYNSTNFDSIYGNSPPVQGFHINYYSGLTNYDPLHAKLMAGFINYNEQKNNEPDGTGPPENIVQFYRYLRDRWRDGFPLTKGGLGYNQSSTDTVTYAFDGDPTDNFKRGWTEINSGNIPGDRKGLNTMGPFYLPPGGYICMEFAFPYARDYNGNNLSAINLLRERVKADDYYLHHITDAFHECYDSPTGVGESKEQNRTISIYPNPGNGNFQLSLKGNYSDKNDKLEIYNVIGQKIFQSRTNGPANLNIDISSQPAGIYFVKTLDGNRWNTTKITLMH